MTYTSPVKFESWGKTGRFFRDIVITEKIDGTNAAIGVVKLEDLYRIHPEGKPEEATILDNAIFAEATVGGERFGLYAQSKNRLIAPGNSDNYGFAGWVERNADDLAAVLGDGLHFGEWWGSGIQRTYGLKGGDKRFSLFNTRRFKDEYTQQRSNGLLRGVPVLYEGVMDQGAIEGALTRLLAFGSEAQPGFMNPEGICIFHTSSGTVSKVTLDNNDKGKWEV